MSKPLEDNQIAYVGVEAKNPTISEYVESVYEKGKQEGRAQLIKQIEEYVGQSSNSRLIEIISAMLYHVNKDKTNEAGNGS